MTDHSEGARDSTNQSRPPGMQRAVQKGRGIVENAVWSATKTRQYHLESRTRMPFRRGAIRGHSTVAPPITRPIRADLPACNARHRLWYKRNVPSFIGIPFNDAVQKGRRFVENASAERNENTSISSGVTDTNAISKRCNQETLDSGATYHSTNQNRPPGIQRAGVG